MVLGDNQKSDNPHLQFVCEVKDQKQFVDLFGNSGTEDLHDIGASFHLAPEDDDVWDNPLAWQQIYAPKNSNPGSRE